MEEISKKEKNESLIEKKNKKDKIFLEWSNINYTIQVTASAR